MALLDAATAAFGSIKANANKAVKYLQSHQSVADEFRAISGDDALTDALLPSVARGVNDSATQYGTTARLAGEAELSQVHRTLDNESGMTGIGRVTNVKGGLAARNALQSEALEWLYTAHKAFQRGEPVPELPKNPSTARVIDSYIKSGFAEKSYDRMAESGIDAIESAVRSPYYAPIQHNPHNVFRIINGNEENFKAVARAYGDQLIRQWPNLVTVVGKSGEALDSVMERVGAKFLNNMKQRMQGQSAHIEGTTKEQLAAILRDAGADDKTVNSVLQNLAPNMEAAGQSKNLRRRVGWDVSKKYPLPTGGEFRIMDGLNQNMEQVLRTYNNSNSARVGLAHKGFISSGDLTSAFNKISDQYVGNPDKHAEVVAFLDNTKNLLLGRPVGEKEGMLLQASSAAARALHLKNSGIYNMIEYANSIREFGFTTVMKHFSKGFKRVLRTENVTPEQAQKVTGIINGRLIAEGKLHGVVTHMDSGYQSDLHDSLVLVNNVSQSIKYLNGSEYIRRHHIGLITSIQGDLLEGLTRGEVKSTEYLRSLGMEDARIAELKSAIEANGLYDSLWPRDLADEVATRLTSSVDSLALQVRKGDLPSFLAYSSVGKVLFPYFTFVAASNNKILRKEYNRNGAVGVAMNMVTSAPLAYMAAVMANITANKDPFDNVNAQALSIIPTLGYAGLPVNFGMRGEFGGTPIPFATINAVPQLLDAAAKGDIDGMIKNSPVLAVTLPVRLVSSALSEDD